MEKVALKNIYLLNWYGFIKRTIPIDDDLTFITGENESGKSTILDAFKYAFLGDTEYNKSSGNAKRNLVSYTRCLIDPSTETYARSPKDIPTVYSHIALEFSDQLNHQDFVLGVIIETSSNNDTTPLRYVLKDKKLQNIQFTYYENDKEKVYSSKKFSAVYKTQLFNVGEGLDQFMAMVGLRLDKNSRKDYTRRLRNMMTYKAESRIPEFIKKFVLEANDIDFQKLKKSKNNIDQINLDLENIQKELNLLDEILSNFVELDKISQRLVLDDVKDIYEKILKLEHLIEENEKASLRNESSIKDFESQIPKLKKQVEDAINQLTDAKSQLNNLDGAKALEDEKNNKIQLQELSTKLKTQADELNRFQEMLKNILSYDLFEEYDYPTEILYNLETGMYTAGDKDYAVYTLKEYLTEQNQLLTEKIGQLKYQLNDVNNKISQLDNRIRELNRNHLDYSHMKNQFGLLQEIKSEFKRRKIDADIKFACEYVLKVIEPEWQQAIEAFLGIHRYAIIVESKYFDIANSVLDKSSFKYVELVRTKALEQREMKVFEDSVVHKLEIENEIAKKYFEYWLGRIHAVKKNDVDKYDSAMSKEGKLSRNMSVTYINFSSLKEYCLGLDAIRLTKEKLTSQKNELENEESDLLKKRNEVTNDSHVIAEILTVFKDFNYDAPMAYLNTLTQIRESDTRIMELSEALENNGDYIALSNRVSHFEDVRKEIEERHSQTCRKKDSLEDTNKHLKSEIKKNRIELRENKSKLENLKLENPIQVKHALDDCKLYSYLTIQSAMRSKATRDKDIRQKNTLESVTIPDLQRQYNSNKGPEDQLNQGIEYEASYRARKNKIEIDDLEKLKNKMRKQTHDYERIFKNDFCSKVYQSANSALVSIRDINKELYKLNFSTRYQFRINLVNDGSDYSKIIDYAKYLKDTALDYNGQMMLDGVNGYSSEEMEKLENDILEIINRISSSRDDDEEILKFSDYRNYLQYEIEINNESTHDGKLSKQINYDSGAATQIPYLLILSASLSMFYNSRPNSARLIFIDEPFEKMSDPNIKRMLAFFKEQNFQVILCAPSNKMDSIGSECNTIVPVIKKSKQTMLIGKVKFKEAHGL